MKASTTDRVEGKFREVKGATKGAVGAVVKDRQLEVEGMFEKDVGKVLGSIGRLEKVVGK
jgi:uncharacterized protein YjbJ (UPF0337 family)